jgi:hypothetical protein
MGAGTIPPYGSFPRQNALFNSHSVSRRAAEPAFAWQTSQRERRDPGKGRGWGRGRGRQSPNKRRRESGHRASASVPVPSSERANSDGRRRGCVAGPAPEGCERGGQAPSISRPRMCCGRRPQQVENPSGTDLLRRKGCPSRTGGREAGCAGHVRVVPGGAQETACRLANWRRQRSAGGVGQLGTGGLAKLRAPLTGGCRGTQKEGGCHGTGRWRLSGRLAKGCGALGQGSCERCKVGVTQRSSSIRAKRRDQPCGHGPAMRSPESDARPARRRRRAETEEGGACVTVVLYCSMDGALAGPRDALSNPKAPKNPAQAQNALPGGRLAGNRG